MNVNKNTSSANVIEDANKQVSSDNLFIVDAQGNPIQASVINYGNQTPMPESSNKAKPSQVLDDLSWDKKAKATTDKLYQQGVAEAEQAYSTKMAELNATAAASQESLEMQKYVDAQTADKLGWSGGYVLDQKRQLDVLKAGIQASLYNEKELQRLGFTSQLAAARLNADIKNDELAHQYYQEALQNAINIADRTGFYLPPEASEYLTQKNVAKQMLEEYSEGSEEYNRAQKVITEVEKYFKANGLSEAGQETLAHMQTIAELEQQDWLNKYSLLSTLITDEDYKNGNIDVIRDNEGNPIYGDLGIETINYNKVTTEEILKALNQGATTEGTNNNAHILEGYINKKLTFLMTGYEGYLTKNNLSISQESFNKYLEQNPGLKDDTLNILKELSEGATGDDLQEIISNANITWNSTSTGESITISIKDGKFSASAVEQAVPKVEASVNTEGLTTNQVNTIAEWQKNSSNKLLNKETASINEDGDKFSNNSGDRGDGNNCSLLINGEVYRVQSGQQVIYGSALDKYLQSLDGIGVGSLAIVDGILYARDNTCWYVIEPRANSFKGDWEAITKAYNLKAYDSNYNNNYTTSKKQKDR